MLIKNIFVKKKEFSKSNEEKASARLKAVAKGEKAFYFTLLNSSTEGLSSQEVAERQETYGLNIVIREKTPSWFIQLLKAFVNPFTGILIVIALISLFTEVLTAIPGRRDYNTVIVIGVLVLISSFLHFWQEFRSNRAAEQLKRLVSSTALVKRKQEGKNELDFKEIVPGDIVLLSAGDMIPADCRIIESKDLFISQAALTGETMPVEKREITVPDADAKSLLELDNICFMGSTVVSGAASIIVVNTGQHTYFGSISRTMTEKRTETSFDKGINQVSRLLIRFMLVMVPVIFLINGIIKQDWLEAMLFAIAVAVGLTPEMLPMIVTTNLAKGALSMSRKKVIVKRLNAIQNIGAMDILCTDKTGTLTMDKIVLETYLNIYAERDKEVLKWAYLNSYHQTGLRNLMDAAILEHMEVEDHIHADTDFEKVDEIPFDFERRRMSVILQQRDGKHLLICKGAVEEMLDLCSHAFDPGEDKELHIEKDQVVWLNSALREKVSHTSQQLNEDGLKVLLVAIKEFDERELTYSVEDEKDMTLAGFIGFLDPAKPSAKPAIEELHQLGLEIKVLTGDNELVTKKICKDVGVPVANIILGHELDQLTDTELSDQINQVSIFAKLNPLQKSRIVGVLKAKGHTIGFLGDGINDGPALREADVGISVDNATDIAKEGADIILLEKDLMVLRGGVIYGRRTFGNTIKYIKMATSSNFGNMFSMLGASIFLPFLPMLPIQILVQNLLYDISQVSIPWDKMDEEYIEKPKRWDASGLARFMLFIGPTSSLFDYATFALMFFVFKANAPEHQSLFQTGWFVEGLLSQTLIVHMIRTKKVPFLQSWATAPVIALTSLVMLAGIAVPFIPFLADAFRMQPLPVTYFPFLLLILVSYCLLTQFVKRWFIKKFGYWL